ncbi:MAG: hypothetical protein APR63_05275 [Desulfuromonas sp. SDB]|nr:MAG: hypothetical protein APR63_05275 [Desulfuromonas sp. SDB]
MGKGICCPKFDPIPWNEKDFEWKDKKFIKGKVFTLFYMPMNFKAVIKGMMKKIEDAGANTPDGMGLSDHTSKWNMDLYVAVDREIPGAENTTLSGKFVSKVYEGPYKNTGKWCEDFQDFVKNKNLNIKKWYLWYTTCPKCAKKYGNNYVTIIGKID